MRSNRRRFLTYALALTVPGAGIGAAACSAGSRPSTAKPSPTRAAAPPKRLTLSWWTDTGYPSPFAFSSLGPGGIVKLSMLFDSLLWKDAHGLVPWLATSWNVQSDGKEIVFKLRPGVVWHDGTPFSADDVAFSFNYFAQHPFTWADTSMVAAAASIDPLTVSIRLARPFAPFLHDVGGVLPMIPKHIWSGVSDPKKLSGPSSAIGTGPFRFGSYAAGQGAYLFKANPSFFAGRPAYDELAYLLLPEQQQPLALQHGQADGALSTDFDVQAKFQTGRYRVLTTQPFSIVRLVFNVNRPPFDQQAFRQAIAYALDRQQIGERVIHGDVTLGNPGVIPPGSPWYFPGVMQYAYNPAKAGALLDSLGYLRPAAGGLRQRTSQAPLRIELLADANDADAPIIQSMLQQVGIGVDIAAADPKTRTDRLNKLDYQMGLLAHIGVGGDPDFLRQWYSGHTANSFADGNVFHDATFAQLAQEQAATMDDRRRHDLVNQMQQILAEQLPTLPLYHRPFFWIYNPSACNRWFNTWSGIMDGIPLADNKLALLSGA